MIYKKTYLCSLLWASPQNILSISLFEAISLDTYEKAQANIEIQVHLNLFSGRTLPCFLRAHLLSYTCNNLCLFSLPPPPPLQFSQPSNRDVFWDCVLPC